jgi:hypothetical protein
MPEAVRSLQHLGRPPLFSRYLIRAIQGLGVVRVVEVCRAGWKRRSRRTSKGVGPQAEQIAETPCVIGIERVPVERNKARKTL